MPKANVSKAKAAQVKAASKTKTFKAKAATKATAAKVKTSKAKAAPKATALKVKAVSRTKAVSVKASKAKTALRAKSSKSTQPTPHRQTEIEDQALAGETILTPDDAQPMLSAGSGDTWDYQPDPQVTAIMAEEQAVETGGDELAEELQEYTSTSPILSGGDVDADWEGANSGGEETVGGHAPTPDQDRVDELGEAAGLVYQDEEPLDTRKKLEKRDTDRWELDPASDGR